MRQLDTAAPPLAIPWLVLLCTAWILPGLFGHEPWKPDEAYTLGLVYHIVQTGDWIVPTLAGEPFVEKPPAFFIIAALFANAFSSWLPLHDGARIATAFFLALICLFTALARQALNNNDKGTLAVLILLGCLGLPVRAHQLITDVALLCGFAMAYYAFAVSSEKPRRSGLLLGTGVGLGFMSKGLIAPGIIGLIAIALPMASRNWRHRNYFLCLAISLVAMLPWLAIWPWLLYQRSPQVFHEWFFVQNWGRFFGSARLSFPNQRWFYFSILPWYGWPAWPLALWALWRGGNAGLKRVEILLPLVCCLVIILVLSVAGEARELYGLPLLIPLALLAAAGEDMLKHRSVLILDRVFVTLLLSLAGGLWFSWLALLINWPLHWVQWIRDMLQPVAPPKFQPVAFVSALCATIICLAVLKLAHKDHRRAVINWTACIALIWALPMTLWLPFIDEKKGYEKMMAELHAAMPAEYNCIASRQLGEPQRALLHYYLGLITSREENSEGGKCELLLVQGSASNGSHSIPSYRKIWQGSRPGDTSERFWLFQRNRS
jgi:4-amino-4-deoxy-L-arabinose transferase-like glycosyltransferase